MPLAHLSIGTSTNRISLLSERGGFMLDDWQVGGTEYGAIFQESQLADFRQMAAYRDVTTFDTFALKLWANSQDTAARQIQDLRTIVRLCLDFWTSTYQTSVVYLSARASCETNMRHAVVYDMRLVGESNPFGQPFLQATGNAVMDALSLIVERGPWLENAPGTGTCVEISSQAADNTIFVLDFDGVDDDVNCGSGASIDNLPSAGNFTAEAWIKAEGWGEGNFRGHIFDKGVWILAVDRNLGLYAFASYLVTTAQTSVGLDNFTVDDGEWHHVAAVWTLASLQWDIAIDGVWVDTTIRAGVGAYAGDGGSDLIIGNDAVGARTFDGLIGMSRISSIARYTVGNSFTPPDRCTCPTDDGDTVALWCLTEGTGATAYDETANNNDGTIVGATWIWAGCEKNYTATTSGYPYTLWFDGVDDNVDCGSGATIDNLPSAANFTAEAWIKADSFGEGGLGRIFDKGFWRVHISNTMGVRCVADYATDAQTWTGLDDFSIDGEWHHITAIWLLGALAWYIAIDGVWVSTTTINAIAPYAGDAAAALIIGNNAGGTATFEGQIGWSRVSSGSRYTVGVAFTPPDRCEFPATDGTTLGLWIQEGAGAIAYDYSGNANDGAITGAVWTDSGCIVHQEATCDAQSVFVANKHNVAQLTHIRWWDESAGAWNVLGNLVGTATPFTLLPAAPAVDDFALFGINTALADSGPFSSLVFDIGTAIGAGATLEWRYKGGGDTDDPQTWTALTVQDNTNAGGAMTGDPFDTLGIGSVHWEQPADWVTSNPNAGAALGVTGYWVACYVTAGPAASPPEQDNRDIYTVTWPYMEFAADEVAGDMPALLRLSVDSRSAQTGLGATTDLWCQRILAGLRSYDRGADFTAFVNLSDTQLPPGVTVAVGANTVFGAVVTAPTGRAPLYTALAAEAMATRLYVRLFPDYYGRFHAFVRGKQVAGAAGAVGVRLGYAAADSAWPAVKFTVTRQFLNLNDDQLLDMGEIVLGPAVDLFPLEVSHTFIELEASALVVGDSAYFYELILIPIDEWAIDAEDMLKNTGALGYTNDYWSHWEGDGIRNQRNILSNLIGTVSDKIARYWRPITNGLPILQAGKRQRLWFLHARYDDYADADDLRADSEIASTVQIWKQQRYSTLRGDR